MHRDAEIAVPGSRLLGAFARVRDLPGRPCGEHLEESEFVTYAADESAVDEQTRIDRHLQSCPLCCRQMDHVVANLDTLLSQDDRELATRTAASVLAAPLLESGQERGFLSYSEVAEVLPDDLGDNVVFVGRFFSLLESHGIEVVDDVKDVSSERCNDFSEPFGLALKTLTPREVELLRMRFGVGRVSGTLPDETDSRYAVTRERIRQIEAKALRRLTRKGTALAAKLKSSKRSS